MEHFTPPYPRRREDLREHALPDGVLLYSPPQMRAFFLNPSAYAVWELCDGTRPIQQIAEELAQELNRPATDILQDVANAVDQLQKEGLLISPPEGAQGGPPSA